MSFAPKKSATSSARTAILLLLGGDVSIKLADNELLLRTSEAAKDIRCAVLAMSLRSEVEKRERSHQAAQSCYAESGREISCLDDPETVR